MSKICDQQEKLNNLMLFKIYVIKKLLRKFSLGSRKESTVCRNYYILKCRKRIPELLSKLDYINKKNKFYILRTFNDNNIVLLYFWCSDTKMFKILLNQLCKTKLFVCYLSKLPLVKLTRLYCKNHW